LTKRTASSRYCPDEIELWAAQESVFPILGVDEAGRGPLAGPVTAAAVMLPRDHRLVGLWDSKLLTESKRELLFDQIRDVALGYGVFSVSAAAIDQQGILPSTFEAMRQSIWKAIESGEEPELVVVDGNLPIPDFERAQRAVVKGDRRSQNIAAASVLAKVTRDRWMIEMSEKWPEYGFSRHKGYGTKAHLAAIAEYGPCPIHRQTFRGVSPGSPA